MHRLFFAVQPPKAIVDACFDVMEGGPAGWAWQEEEQLHVTLRFIGEVDGRQADDIVDAIAAVHVKQVEIGIEGIGWFDHGASGALFARVGPKPPLEALHRKLDHLMVRLGHAPERRSFLPHITLARRRRGAEPPHDWLRTRSDFRAPSVSARRLTLYESRLGRGGASYEPLIELPLHA